MFLAKHRKSSFRRKHVEVSTESAMILIRPLSSGLQKQPSESMKM